RWPRGAYGRQGSEALAVSRLRIARVAGPASHDWQPDGRTDRSHPLAGGLFRLADVRVALSDAPASAAWIAQGSARHRGAPPVSGNSAACEAALTERAFESSSGPMTHPLRTKPRPKCK